MLAFELAKLHFLAKMRRRRGKLGVCFSSAEKLLRRLLVLHTKKELIKGLCVSMLLQHGVAKIANHVEMLAFFALVRV